MSDDAQIQLVGDYAKKLDRDFYEIMNGVLFTPKDDKERVENTAFVMAMVMAHCKVICRLLFQWVGPIRGFNLLNDIAGRCFNMEVLMSQGLTAEQASDIIDEVEKKHAKR